jgi:aquaporin Z
MAAENRGDQYIAAVGTRYLLRFEEGTQRERRLPIRVIIEFFGTFMVVTVAPDADIIRHYVGGSPVSRAAAVIARTYS